MGLLKPEDAEKERHRKSAGTRCQRAVQCLPCRLPFLPSMGELCDTRRRMLAYTLENVDQVGIDVNTV
jgi:hypothetical protein